MTDKFTYLLTCLRRRFSVSSLRECPICQFRTNKGSLFFSHKVVTTPLFSLLTYRTGERVPVLVPTKRDFRSCPRDLRKAETLGDTLRGSRQTLECHRKQYRDRVVLLSLWVTVVTTGTYIVPLQSPLDRYSEPKQPLYHHVTHEVPGHLKGKNSFL